MAMLFWGVEVKAGEPTKVQPGEGWILHLSQATLGESKKGNESANLYVNIDGQKLVLGTLSADKHPNQTFDLIFEKDFELSHNWKSGSVHFLGYRAEANPDDSDSEDMFDSEDEDEVEEEDIPLVSAENGKPVKTGKSKAFADKAKVAKPDSATAKTKAKVVKPVSDDDSSEEDDSDEDDSDDEDMIEDDDDDDDEESSDEEDETTPKNAKKEGKRPVESTTKTPVPAKKAKLVTPQKSGGDGKKGNSHTATPHPSKGGKTADKSKPQTIKSGSQVSCKSCSKTFNSDGALQSHTKAKHSDGK